MTENETKQLIQDQQAYTEYLKSLGGGVGFLDYFYLAQVLLLIGIFLFTDLSFVAFFIAMMVVLVLYAIINEIKAPKLKTAMSFDEFRANRFPELDQ